MTPSAILAASLLVQPSTNLAKLQSFLNLHPKYSVEIAFSGPSGLSKVKLLRSDRLDRCEVLNGSAHTLAIGNKDRWMELDLLDQRYEIGEVFNRPTWYTEGSIAGTNWVPMVLQADFQRTAKSFQKIENKGPNGFTCQIPAADPAPAQRVEIQLNSDGSPKLLALDFSVNGMPARLTWTFSNWQLQPSIDNKVFDLRPPNGFTRSPAISSPLLPTPGQDLSPKIAAILQLGPTWKSVSKGKNLLLVIGQTDCPDTAWLMSQKQWQETAKQKGVQVILCNPSPDQFEELEKWGLPITYTPYAALLLPDGTLVTSFQGFGPQRNATLQRLTKRLATPIEPSS